MAIEQEYYLKKSDGSVFKGTLFLLNVGNTDRDGFEVEGEKGRFIVASTNIPTKGLKRGTTPDKILEQYQEVSKEEFDKAESEAEVKVRDSADAAADSASKAKAMRRQLLVKYFRNGDLYNKNKDLFILKEGFDPDSVG